MQANGIEWEAKKSRLVFRKNPALNLQQSITVMVDHPCQSKITVIGAGSYFRAMNVLYGSANPYFAAIFNPGSHAFLRRQNKPNSGRLAPIVTFDG